MLIAQMKKRRQDRRRQLRLETLEPRNLLTGTVSGTVFEDLNGDGVQDPGEPGMAGETVVLERVDTLEPLVTIPNPNPLPAADEHFGGTVLAIGNNIVAGDHQADYISNAPGVAPVLDAGAAYLLDGETGEVLLTIENPDPTQGDLFGGEMAVFGSDIFIQSARDDAGAIDAGTVYLMDGSTGGLLQTYHNPEPNELDRFGNSITAVGNKVVIGCYYDDTGGDNAGSVYVFDVATGAHELTIHNPSPQPSDSFGMRITAIGDTLAISAINADMGAMDAGVVYLFDMTGNLLQTIANPDPGDGDRFGGSLAALGDSILIGASGDGGVGTVYLVDPATGTVLQSYHNPTPEEGDQFGTRITPSADGVIIWAKGDDTIAPDSGALYLFDAETGGLLHTYLNPEGVDGDQLGRTVAFLGNKVVTGSKWDDTRDTDAGAIYIFEGVIVTETNANGEYLISDLDAGEYAVRQILSDGFAQTTPGGDGTHSVTVSVGQDATGVDFGNQWIPISVFADSFEYGQWNGLWVEDSQNDWFTSTQRAAEGSYSAEVDGSATDATLSIANPIDLTPYGSAELTFDWYIESGFDAGEYLALDLFDGTSWHEVAKLSGNLDQENTWHSEAITVDGAYLVDDFQFRFRAKVSSSNEDANVDNVQLVATSLVTPPNADPTAGNDTATADEDNVVIIPVLANDTDSDGDPLTVASVTQGAHGAVTINADNTVTYTPDADANGVDTFTYTVSDGTGGVDTGTVTVTVAAGNDAPVADSQTVTTDQSAAVGITLTANDVDPDPLGFTVVAGPSNGTLSGTAPNLTYTPTGDFTGDDSFTFVANDGTVDSNVATVSITVAAVATGPNLAHGVVPDVGSDWITVDLGTTYGSMVVIATPNYDSASYPGVVRIQNAVGSSFDVRIDAAGPYAPDLMDVYYVVVEEGVYDEPGFKMEAVKFTSTVTDENNNWTGESRTYQQTYTSPVVVGQVMTSNDAWSVFWAAGSSRTCTTFEYRADSRQDGGRR